MALLALVRTPARITCFVLGLLVGFGVDLWLGPGGHGHDPRAFLSFLGYAVALAAVLVEVATFFIRRRRSRGDEALPDD
jgi:hypothetical protein